MQIITLLLRSSWKIVVIAGISSLVNGLSTAGLITVINHQVNSGVVTATVVWNFAGLCCLRFVTYLLSRILLISLTEKTILELRMLLSSRIIASPLYHLEQLGSHRILATLTSDIAKISRTVFFIPNLFIDIATVVCCLVYLFYLSPTIFCLTVLFLALAIFNYQLLNNKARPLISLARKKEDSLFYNFRSITEGIKELKLHHQRSQTFLFKELYETANSYRHQNVAGMSILAIAVSWSYMLFFIAVGLALFALPAFKLIIVTPQIISGYVLTTLYLISPIDNIIGSLPIFSKATVSLANIDSLKLSLSNYTCKNNELHLMESDRDCQQLELLGITHTYQDQEDTAFTLGPIDLTFWGGQIVFIVGGNGSGKSTLVKLITGLYFPENGNIYLNGKLITTEIQDWYRQHFSVVFSDFYLFDNFLNLGKTIADNEINEYLVKLQLNKKVQVKNGILSTTSLSQGQRKRLALLTAYLEDRPIYVFDEWASDQDPVFKSIFYTKILPELKHKGKTVIVVTHDDQYFHLSDRIIKLDYGKVEESGSHSVRV